MRRAPLVVLVITVATSVAVLLSTAQHARAANPACPEEAPGELFTLSRTVVPIGVASVRTFQIDKRGAKATIYNLAVSAPAGYESARVTSKAGYALRLRAPQAGQFDVRATWTVTYDDGSGPITCDASKT